MTLGSKCKFSRVSTHTSNINKTKRNHKIPLYSFYWISQNINPQHRLTSSFNYILVNKLQHIFGIYQTSEKHDQTWPNQNPRQEYIAFWMTQNAYVSQHVTSHHDKCSTSFVSPRVKPRVKCMDYICLNRHQIPKLKQTQPTYHSG